MKYLITLFLVLITAVCFGAAREELIKDGREVKIQTHAPNGKKDFALTVAKQTINMRDDIHWAVYAPSDCSYRTMSSATVAGMKKTIVGGAWHPRGVNPKTPFISYTGCASGQGERF